jgi:hypothetical protein
MLAKGKVWGLGYPPPKLIMPGMDNRGNIARMGEGSLPLARRASRSSMDRAGMGYQFSKWTKESQDLLLSDLNFL